MPPRARNVGLSVIAPLVASCCQQDDGASGHDMPQSLTTRSGPARGATRAPPFQGKLPFSSPPPPLSSSLHQLAQKPANEEIAPINTTSHTETETSSFNTINTPKHHLSTHQSTHRNIIKLRLDTPRVCPFAAQYGILDNTNQRISLKKGEEIKLLSRRMSGERISFLRLCRFVVLYSAIQFNPNILSWSCICVTIRMFATLLCSVSQRNPCQSGRTRQVDGFA